MEKRLVIVTNQNQLTEKSLFHGKKAKNSYQPKPSLDLVNLLWGEKKQSRKRAAAIICSFLFIFRYI